MKCGRGWVRVRREEDRNERRHMRREKRRRGCHGFWDVSTAFGTRHGSCQLVRGGGGVVVQGAAAAIFFNAHVKVCRRFCDSVVTLLVLVVLPVVLVLLLPFTALLFQPLLLFSGVGIFLDFLFFIFVVAAFPLFVLTAVLSVAVGGGDDNGENNTETAGTCIF